MREPLADFGSLQSQGGMSSIGQLSNINHSLGSEMASNGVRAMAFSKTKEYQRQANEALAKSKVPPSAVGGGGFGQIAGAVKQGAGLLQQFGIGAKAPGTTPAAQPVQTGDWQAMTEANNTMLDSFGGFSGLTEVDFGLGDINLFGG